MAGRAPHASDRPPLAELHVDGDGEITTVTVNGEIDMSNVAEVEEKVLDLPNASLGIVLDLGGATFIDSATIRMLFAVRSRLTLRRQQLVLVSTPGSPVRRVLELAGYPLEEGSVQPSLAQALAAVRVPPST